MTGALSIQDILGYDSGINRDKPAGISLGSSTNGFLQWDGKGRVSWNETGGVLSGGYANSSASIIRWDRVQVDDSTRYDYASYTGVITDPKHIANKEYVDDKMQELLTRIEELEMSGGGTNYRFEFKTRTPFTSGEPGSAMDSSMIFSQSKLYSNNDSWYVTTGSETSGLGGENGWVYVCFDSDEWAMNSTGSLHSVQRNPNNSADTFNRDSKVFNLAISNAEKCPDEYSNGKNIWRFEVVPILYKNRDYENQYLSHYENDMDIYVTFAGGSLTKTSTP